MATRRRTTPLRAVIVLAVLAVIVYLVPLLARGGTNSEATPGATAVPSATASVSPEASGTPGASGSPGTALALLATLTVKGKSPLTGYDREGDFGRAWLDVDHNGCDTRNDILARDLSRLVREGRCKVLSGIRKDPYTGTTISFVRGQTTSTLVQIDHVIPLANAWQTGAQKLTEAMREALANDPLNLLAVDGRTNEQKSDSDASAWLPPVKSYRCTYIARQISVKAKYALWVTKSEAAAMRRVLRTCPTQLAFP